MLVVTCWLSACPSPSSDDDDSGDCRYFKDADHDGYGNELDYLDECVDPGNDWSPKAGDCDDKDRAVYPGASELCNDGKDNDCDGEFDEKAEEICDSIDNNCNGETDEHVTTTFYRDVDKDGYGIEGDRKEACSAPDGYTNLDGDCADGDEKVSPAALEVCDAIDNNCDGKVDEGLTIPLFKDEDKDGFGSGEPEQLCSAKEGYATVSGDCNDADRTFYPGAPEACGEPDKNCDGVTSTKSTWFKDGDQDTYGSNSSTTEACEQPSGYVAQNGDCNDTKAAMNPGATEVCDLLDNDCDTGVDEDVQTTWYVDTDSDGYGTDTSVGACTRPAGYVSQKGDCDDSSPASYPGALEACDEEDNDCDGKTDEEVKITYFLDADLDGYGSSTTTESCSRPQGYATQGGDCNDASQAIHPGASELCNSTDDDCDGLTDEGALKTYYKDGDSDGYGKDSSTAEGCSDLPAGYAASKGDCNDSNNTVYPGAHEACDTLDNDCDGMLDEDAVAEFWSVTGSSLKGQSEDAMHFGLSLATVGDVNADGYGDVLVGAPGAAKKGAVFLFLGSSSGLTTTPSWGWEGTQEGESFGFSVASAGDVNKDGYMDLLVGSPGFDADPTIPPGDEGKFSLFLGSPTGMRLSFTRTGSTAREQLGYTVSTAGDVQGDGYPDVVASSPGFGSGTGKVWFFQGSSSGLTLSGWTYQGLSGSYTGRALASPGDVNDDGYADLLVGADSYTSGQTGEGCVFLFLGSSSGLSATPSWKLEGDKTAAAMGRSVSAAGDVNGDKIDDFIVGAPGYPGSTGKAVGAAFVYLGTSGGLPSLAGSLQVPQDGASFGYQVSPAGDMDGDGFDDVAISAPYYDNPANAEGGVFVFYGNGVGPDAAFTLSLEGESTNRYVGLALAGGGDVNRDGIPELLVGSDLVESGWGGTWAHTLCVP